MQLFLLTLHNILRWAIVLLLLLSIIVSFVGWQKKKELTASDANLWRFTMTAAHLNFVVGIYHLLFGRFGIISAGLPPGVQLMKDHFYRFYWVEHPVGMLITILLITFARGQVKKQESDVVRHKRAFWLFLLAAVVILATVPWPWMALVGRNI